MPVEVTRPEKLPVLTCFKCNNILLRKCIHKHFSNISLYHDIDGLIAHANRIYNNLVK